MAEPGGRGLPPWHPQILADQLTLSQPRGADYAPHISTPPQIFSPCATPGMYFKAMFTM